MKGKSSIKYQNTIITSKSQSSSIFSNLDFTSPEPKIKIFGENRYKNSLGAFISLIWFIVLISFSINFLLDFFSNKKVTILENTFISDSPKLFLNETPIMILLQNNLTEPINENAWRVNFLYWINENIINANGTKQSFSNHLEIPAENCQQKHYGKHWYLFKNIPNIDKYYCLPKEEKYNNLTLFGTYGDIKPHSLLGIYISKCVNDELLNITQCFEEKITNNYLKNSFINIKYLAYKTNHYENIPYSSYVYSVDIPVSITIYKREFFYLSNVFYSSDDDVLLRTYKNYFYYMINKHVSYFDFEEKGIFPGNFVSLNFLMTNQNKVYNRYYYKIPDLLADIGGLSRIIRVFAHFVNGYFYSTLFYVKLISSYFNFKQEKDYDDEDFSKIKFNNNQYLYKNSKSKNKNKFTKSKYSKDDNQFFEKEIIEEEFIFKPFSFEENKKNNFDLTEKFISKSDKKYCKNLKKRRAIEKIKEKKKLDFNNCTSTNSQNLENLSLTHQKNANSEDKNEEGNLFNKYFRKESDGIERFDLDLNIFNNQKLNQNIDSTPETPECYKYKQVSSEIKKMNFLISESLGICKDGKNIDNKENLNKIRDLNYLNNSDIKTIDNNDKSSVFKKSILSKSNYLNKKYEYKYKKCNYFYCLCIKNRKTKDFMILKDYINRQMSIDFIIKKIREIDKMKLIIFKSYQIPIFNSMPYKVISLKNGFIDYKNYEENKSQKNQNSIENYNNYSNISYLTNDSVIEKIGEFKRNNKKLTNKETLFDYDYNSYILQDALTSSNIIEKKNKRNNIDKNLLKFWECNEFEN